MDIHGGISAIVRLALIPSKIDVQCATTYFMFLSHHGLGSKLSKLDTGVNNHSARQVNMDIVKYLLELYPKVKDLYVISN
jgi:hypothetical protein